MDNTTLFDHSTGECVDINGCRTVSEIIWSCLSVIFICTWVAIHPNIPVIGTHWAVVIYQNIELMVIALLAPEFMILSATRQRASAKKIGKRFAKYGWGITHGFFVIMGGFALYDGETFRGYIWDRDRGLSGDQPYEGQAEGYLEQIKAYHQKHHDDLDTVVGFKNDDADEKASDPWPLPILHDERSAIINPDQENRPLTNSEAPNLLEFLVTKGYITVTEDEVRDRSHADVISKSIAIIQTAWFLLQVIARAVKGLAVTELEIITVGFAILNFITYFLWWNKPLRVRHPIRVHWRPKDARITNGHLEDKRKDSFGTIIGSVVAYIWWEDHPTTGMEWIWQLALLPIWVFVHIFLVSADLLSDEDDKDMAVLFSSRLQEDRPLLVIAVYGIAALFGAIHCIPWAFQFPTHTELLLWRIAAVAVAAAPIVMAFLHGYEKKLWDSTPNWLNNIMTAVAFLLAISYAVFRVTLIVLAFMALRKLPSSAYQTVQWTAFIPHIG